MAQVKRRSVLENPNYDQDSQQNNSSLQFTKYLFEEKSWLQKYSAQLENQFRKVVKEEVEKAIQSSSHFASRSWPTQVESSTFKQYKLQFEGKLPHKLFTGNKVVAEGAASVKVQLLDAISGYPIKDGPLSSKKVEIVALHGHFKAEQLENWTKEEFSEHILSKRDNKRPLLVGQHVIALCNGIGFVNDVQFTDNSSWGRSKMFRLGAKVVADEDTVMEAVSSPFRVRHRRGEGYQKHNIPSPEDEVWRLFWIAKKGKIHKRLEEHNIHKVKDLVTQYHNDQSLLRRILNVTREKWNEIIQQATSCFSGNDCTNLSADLAQFHITNDQQEIQVPRSHVEAREHFHQQEQSMALDHNSLLDELLVGSSSNNVHLSSSVDDFVPSISPFTTMFNVQSSRLLHEQSMRGEDTGMLSSILPASDVNTLNNANQGTDLRNVVG